jgi:hypothetical protein
LFIIEEMKAEHSIHATSARALLVASVAWRLVRRRFLIG